MTQGNTSHKTKPNEWAIYASGQYVGRIWQDRHPLGGYDEDHWYAERGCFVRMADSLTPSHAHEGTWRGHGSKADAMADLRRSPRWHPTTSAT